MGLEDFHQSMLATFADGAGDAGHVNLIANKASSNPANLVSHGKEAGGDAVPERSVDLPLRILIPNEYIGAIIGRGGTTIRAISRGTGARIDIFRHFNRNYDIPEKPVSIFGSQQSVSYACRKILELIVQEANHQSANQGEAIALKIFVPNHVVGKIIGKEGCVVKEIMNETQTKIHISHQPEFMERSLRGVKHNLRIIIIRGSIDGMMAAEQLISRKVHEAYIDGRIRDRDVDFGYLFNQLNDSQHQQVQPVYNYPYISNYYTTVPPSQTASAGYATTTAYSLRPNNIVPTTARYQQDDFSWTTFPFYTPTSQDSVHWSRPETVYMYIPDDSVGALIGRGGSSIREIIHSSSASIKVLDGVIPINDLPSRRVVIHGGINSVFVAEFLIYKRIMDESIVQSHQYYDDQLTVEMTVPTMYVGRLIGKGGVNIREVQRQCFCRVKFLTEPDLNVPLPAEDETYVRITGTAYSFLNAQKRIKASLAKAMSKSFPLANNESRLTTTHNECPLEEHPVQGHEAVTDLSEQNP